MEADFTERRGRLRKYLRYILPLFLAGTIAFFGAAGYAIINGRNERTSICNEVKELRDDVVEALDILTSENPNAPEVVQARTIIQTPHCGGE